MELIQAYQNMIKVHGWNGTAATLGLTRTALESRVYEVKGMGMRVNTAMLIQRYSGTTHFAQAVAEASGGVFVELPELGNVSGEDLEAKFHDLYAHLGDLSKTYRAATNDGEISGKEREQLEAISQDMCKTTKELMAIMFQVYCAPRAEA